MYCGLDPELIPRSETLFGYQNSRSKKWIVKETWDPFTETPVNKKKNSTIIKPW